jgi:multicomponent Na+:H+ antiporter subunit G
VSLLVGALLGLSVLGVAVSVLGVVVARDALDRLHYVGPASVIGGGAMLLAVAAETGVGLTTARAAIAVVPLVVLSAVLTHAAARAALVRGDLARLRHQDRGIDR